MIPKVMKFFWGNEKLSWMRYMTLYSFRKLNPDWEMELHLCPPSTIKYKTWLDGVQQDFFNFSGKDFTGKLNSLDIELKEWSLFHKNGKSMQNWMGPSHKSNFFKWGEMATNGGFYSDLDILYTKPLEEYYEKVKEMDTICCYHHDYFSIGFLGSSGNNPFFQDIYDFCFQRFNIKEYQSAGVQTVYTFLRKETEIPNPVPNSKINFWKIIEEKYPELIFYNNPMTFVYPWKFNEMEEVFLKFHDDLPEDCVGIHWYAGDKIAQKYNNKLTQGNYKKFKNTFSFYLEKLLPSKTILGKKK